MTSRKLCRMDSAGAAAGGMAEDTERGSTQGARERPEEPSETQRKRPCLTENQQGTSVWRGSEAVLDARLVLWGCLLAYVLRWLCFG